MFVKNVVAQNQAAGVIVNKVSSDNKGLRESFLFRLHCVFEVKPYWEPSPIRRCNAEVSSGW